MRQVARTQRVDLDWLFERIANDPGIEIHYVGTKEQIADIFTKGQFTEFQWRALCRLAQIGPSYSTRKHTISCDSKECSKDNSLRVATVAMPPFHYGNIELNDSTECTSADSLRVTNVARPHPHHYYTHQQPHHLLISVVPFYF